MASKIAYDISSDSLLHPAKNAKFFEGWDDADKANRDLLCAEMSRLAYAEEEVVRAALAKIDFHPVGFLGAKGFANLKLLGTQGFVAHREGGPTILAFRGTESDKFEDLLVDAAMSQVQWGGTSGVLVHRGFAESWGQVHAAAKGLVERREGELLITGHSLGAAIATLAAIDLQPATLVNFGSPRVGNEDFAALLKGISVRRFVNCCDLVTRLPPERFDHENLSQLLREVAQLERDFSFPDLMSRWLPRLASAKLPGAHFKHVEGEQYGTSGGASRARGDGGDPLSISDAEIQVDQEGARSAYPGIKARKLASLSAHSQFQSLIASLIDPGKRPVQIRDLADHAPINYVSLFTGR